LTPYRRTARLGAYFHRPPRRQHPRPRGGV